MVDLIDRQISTRRTTDGIEVTRSLAIPESELKWRFSTPGGPGGQHANKSSTRVEMVFDAESSSSLGPRERVRIVGRLGLVIKVSASSRRSQFQNCEEARERLRQLILGALRADKVRLPTVVPAAANERRLQDKRKLSRRKQERLRDQSEQAD